MNLPFKILFYFILVFGLTQCDETEATGEEVEIRVGSETVPCMGELVGECLMVQEGEQIGTEEWSYFYYSNSIMEFEYEPGFVYDLLVRKTYIENAPADGPSIEYALVKILEKRKQ